MMSHAQAIDELKTYNFDQLEKSAILKYNSLQDALSILQFNYDAKQWRKVNELFVQFKESVYEMSVFYKNLENKNLNYESIIADNYQNITKLEYELSKFAIKPIPTIKIKKPKIQNPFSFQLSLEKRPILNFNFGSGISFANPSSEYADEFSVGYIPAHLISDIAISSSFIQNHSYNPVLSSGPIPDFFRKYYAKSDLLRLINAQNNPDPFFELITPISKTLQSSFIPIPESIFFFTENSILSNSSKKTSILSPVGTLVSILFHTLKKFSSKTNFKILTADERAKSFSETDGIKLYEKLIKLARSNDMKKMLSELSIYVQYDNLLQSIRIDNKQQPIEIKSMVHNLFLTLLIKLLISDNLRLDEAKHYSSIKTAISYSPLESSNLSSALDSMGIINTTNWPLSRLLEINKNSNPFFASFIKSTDSILSATNLSISNLSLGIPIGIQEHGLKFWRAFFKSIKWYNPFSYPLLILNLWDYFSPLYNLQDSRRLKIINKIKTKMFENHILLQLPVDKLNKDQIQEVFENLLYIQNYYKSFDISRKLFPTVLVEKLRNHLNDFSKSYALICSKAIPRKYFYKDQHYANNYLLLSTLLIQSILFLDQQELNKKEHKIAAFASKYVNQKHLNDCYASLYLFSSPIQSRQVSLRAKLSKILNSNHLSNIESEKLYTLLSETMKFALSSSIIAEKFSESITLLHNEIEDMGIRIAESIQEEFKKDFGSLSTQKFRELADKLEILLFLLPSLIEKSDAMCLDEAEIKLDQIQTKIDTKKILSEGEINFLKILTYLYRSDINLKEVALLGNRFTNDESADLHLIYTKIIQVFSANSK